MAEIQLQGTKFSFTILPTEKKEYWVKTKLAIENEYVHYESADHAFTREEIENLVFSMRRLLAGAYAKEYNLSFEKAGVAVDLCMNVKQGRVLTREERRKEECTMLFRALLKASDKKNYLGGVYSFIFRKKELQEFSSALLSEFQSLYGAPDNDEGEFLFVGVSPKGYLGCNYWYLDTTNSIKSGDYVWVRMGRHNIEQVVYVDSVRYFTKENAPYPTESVKQILRKATEKEIKQAKKEWKKER